ncbi:hypothetical protein FXV77_07330 [Sphingobacterium phlebotomi]|uniref:Peptidase S24/S26A/S26B/S26C domain-containing protein n=1 Tax=Sphingobacterium phlebotomi TaxID=2605433 RepID=A0A5D4H8G7_9SPHI|nr:S24/S26 family peptidase [Sphingobacterium phlebotomi]TYR36978.1 hypothetical protein FXV77_07330 [Sphingobacterium phlebotomi]
MNTKHKQVVKVENEAFFTVVKQRLDVGDQVWIPVVGNSMEPFLREKDDVLLRTARETDVAIGDIALARWGQRYVLHRVVRKKADELWLAGDNNLVQIEKIAAADLIAVLLEARRVGQMLSVSRTFNKSLGILWYYLRLPRRVVVAIKRRSNTFFRR